MKKKPGGGGGDQAPPAPPSPNLSPRCNVPVRNTKFRKNISNKKFFHRCIKFSSKSRVSFPVHPFFTTCS